MQIYMQWSKYDGSTSSFQKLIIPRLPRFEKLALSQFQLYIEAKIILSVLCDLFAKRQFSLEMLKSEKMILVFYTC